MVASGHLRSSRLRSGHASGRRGPLRVGSQLAGRVLGRDERLAIYMLCLGHAYVYGLTCRASCCFCWCCWCWCWCWCWCCCCCRCCSTQFPPHPRAYSLTYALASLPASPAQRWRQRGRGGASSPGAHLARRVRRGTHSNLRCRRVRRCATPPRGTHASRHRREG